MVLTERGENPHCRGIGEGPVWKVEGRSEEKQDYVSWPERCFETARYANLLGNQRLSVQRVARPYRNIEL